MLMKKTTQPQPARPESTEDLVGRLAIFTAKLGKYTQQLPRIDRVNSPGEYMAVSGNLKLYSGIVLELKEKLQERGVTDVDKQVAQLAARLSASQEPEAETIIISEPPVPEKIMAKRTPREQAGKYFGTEQERRLKKLLDETPNWDPNNQARGASRHHEPLD
jgi:hypothetical protein